MQTTLTYREQLNKLSLEVKKEIETIMLRHPSSTADSENFTTLLQWKPIILIVRRSLWIKSYMTQRKGLLTFIYQIIVTTSLAQFVWM